MELEKFDVLWQKIETLLARVEEINRQKENQARLLAQKDQEINHLKESLAVHEKERAQVKGKIDEMLGRIDRIVTE